MDACRNHRGRYAEHENPVHGLCIAGGIHLFAGIATAARTAVASTLNGGVAAVDQEVGARHERGLVTCKERGPASDLFRAPETSDERVMRASRGFAALEIANVTIRLDGPWR